MASLVCNYNNDGYVANHLAEKTPDGPVIQQVIFKDPNGHAIPAKEAPKGLVLSIDDIKQLPGFSDRPSYPLVGTAYSTSIKPIYERTPDEIRAHFSKQIAKLEQDLEEHTEKRIRAKIKFLMREINRRLLELDQVEAVW